MKCSRSHLGVVVALAIGLPAVCLSSHALRPASAEECAFCHKEIDEGRGPNNCKACEQTANDIARQAPQWTIEFKHEKPRRITVKVDEKAQETYWWFPYTIKNNDKDVHAFSIHITAESDKGKNVAKYVDGYVPEVYQALRKALGVKEGDALWHQVDVSQIPQGQQHALPGKEAPPSGDSAKLALPSLQPNEQKKCVAMFKAMDAEMDKLTIQVRGLSSDVEVESIDQPFRRKVRERVLEIVYESPGDEFLTQTRPITFVSQKWTEVERTIKTDLR